MWMDLLFSFGTFNSYTHHSHDMHLFFGLWENYFFLFSSSLLYLSISVFLFESWFEFYAHRLSCKSEVGFHPTIYVDKRRLTGIRALEFTLFRFSKTSIPDMCLLLTFVWMRFVDPFKCIRFNCSDIQNILNRFFNVCVCHIWCEQLFLHVEADNVFRIIRFETFHIIEKLFVRLPSKQSTLYVFGRNSMFV